MTNILSGLVCGFTRSLPDGFAVSLKVFRFMLPTLVEYRLTLGSLSGFAELYDHSFAFTEVNEESLQHLCTAKQRNTIKRTSDPQ